MSIAQRVAPRGYRSVISFVTSLIRLTMPVSLGPLYPLLRVMARPLMTVPSCHLGPYSRYSVRFFPEAKASKYSVLSGIKRGFMLPPLCMRGRIGGPLIASLDLLRRFPSHTGKIWHSHSRQSLLGRLHGCGSLGNALELGSSRWLMMAHKSGRMGQTGHCTAVIHSNRHGTPRLCEMLLVGGLL
jgi:hypothetical protein